MLLCSATFKAIKHMAPELGGATQNGVHVDRLKRPTWGWLWRWAQRTHTNPYPNPYPDHTKHFFPGFSIL